MQTIHRLVSQAPEKPFTDTSLIFAHMVRLAQPVMEAYQGDLYCDALWLHEYASRIPADQVYTFYWCLDTMHTWIGHTRENVGISGTMYRLSVCQAPENSGTWTLIMTTIAR